MSSLTEVSRDGEERIIRWLKRIFWVALIMAVWTIGNSVSVFRTKTSEAQRIEALERSDTATQAFIVSQRKFNEHQADAVRRISEK